MATNGSVILAATAKGIYSSTNNGNSWNTSNNGLYDSTSTFLDSIVDAIAMNGSTVVISTWNTNKEVFISTNSGANWTLANNGLPLSNSVHCLVIIGTTILAGTTNGIYKSINDGANWTPSSDGLPNLQNSSVNNFFSIGNTTFSCIGRCGLSCGTVPQISGIYSSGNNGSTWAPINDGLIATHVLSFISYGVNTFASTDAGIFHTSDNGNSWSIDSLGLPKSCAILAYNGNTIYAGYNWLGQIFYSNNNGFT